jgi:hypothetical protein
MVAVPFDQLEWQCVVRTQSHDMEVEDELDEE